MPTNVTIAVNSCVFTYNISCEIAFFKANHHVNSLIFFTLFSKKK